MSDTKIASDWTAEDSSTRYDLPKGQWVEFRDEVSYGEQAALDIACKPLADELALPKRLAFHVTAWSLTYPVKAGGGPLPVCEESLQAMPMARLWVLLKALQTHTEAVKAKYADPLSEDDSTSASRSAA
jgi:hypothetical protein